MPRNRTLDQIACSLHQHAERALKKGNLEAVFDLRDARDLVLAAAIAAQPNNPKEGA